MSVNRNLSKNWAVELLENDLAGLNEIYREIADEIGIENTIRIFNLFHGTQISFPNRLFSKNTYIKLSRKNITVKMRFNLRKNTIILSVQYGEF